MYTNESAKQHSASRVWQRATYTERNALMIEAGHGHKSIFHTYKHFDELPPEIKVDLNNAHTRKLQTSTEGNRLVIDVLRNAQELGCRLVVNSRPGAA
jgi:hypothetical protein